MMKLWTDGRSGEGGRVVGDLVLNHLEATGGEISKHKGTVFVDSSRCWVGRVVADDGYLTKGVLHWANVSADQHRELEQFASETHRKLLYLFITAFGNSRIVRFWQVPADVLDRELRRLGKTGHGDVMGLHISDRGGSHVIGAEDVSETCTELDIGSEPLAELRAAVRRDSDRRIRPVRSSGAASLVERLLPEAAAGERSRCFDIPLSGGRMATLKAPVPMTIQDVARVKGYIDLMSDLLVT